MARSQKMEARSRYISSFGLPTSTKVAQTESLTLKCIVLTTKESNNFRYFIHKSKPSYSDLRGFIVNLNS